MCQLVGNVVVNGLLWVDGLVGLIWVLVQVLGVGDCIGIFELGKLVDLVLWDGDLLDVGYYVEQVWLGGCVMLMCLWQIELCDCYLVLFIIELCVYLC